MNNIKTRLKELASRNGLSIRSFEEKCGLNRGNISNMSDDGNIGSDKLSKIFDTFPELNPRWLLTGQEPMFVEDKDIPTTIKETSLYTRPRIPFDAAAGSLSIAVGSATISDCEQIPIIPTFPKYDFTIVARGNSMEPQYMSGDELACLFITDSSFIQWGRAHVLDTAQGIVVKRIFDNGNSILCKSNNPDYPDFSIPKCDIFRMAIVVGYIRIE